MPSWTPSLPFQVRERPPISRTAIFKAMQTQARVVWALMLRETIGRYGEYKIGFLWAFIEPFLTVMVFVAIFGATRTDSPGGMPLILFMLTGIVSFSLFKDPMNQMKSAISQNRTILAFPQVTTFDVLSARALMEVAVTLFVLSFMLGMAHLVGFESNVEDPLGVLAVLGLLAMTGIGFGFLISSIEPMMPSINKIISMLTGRPMFLSSGLFFTAETIPSPVREYILYNPILHYMELLRSEYFLEFDSEYGSWGYATAWAFGSLAVGLCAHRGLRRKV